MGSYNPHAPRILGQEWVPIRDENLIFAPLVNSLEVGHTFTLTSSATVNQVRFYINDYPPTYATSQVFSANIYQQGREVESGPVSKVIIPVLGGTQTGGESFGTSAQIAAALLSPSDDNYLGFFSSSIPGSLEVSLHLTFNVSAYSQLLYGKRILGVNVLYLAQKEIEFQGADLVGTFTQDQVSVDFPTWEAYYGEIKMDTIDTTDDSGIRFPNPDVIERTSLGDVIPITPNAFSQWTYAALALFGSTYTVEFFSYPLIDEDDNQVSVLYLYYAALEVFYCEESRTVWGTQSFETGYQNVESPVAARPYLLGANQIPLTSSTSLAAGNYLVTLASNDTGDFSLSSAYENSMDAERPPMNAVRQLYPIPPHTGTQVNVPFPLDDTALGKSFTSEEVQVLPQLSVHTSGGPITPVHVYGRQAIGQVYGNVTVTQNIQDTLANGATTWPWVRYYARRWGNTTIPLTLTGASQSVSITPTEFDELDNIIDGWKEVTLRFATAPTMGAGTFPTFTWSATNETAGNRWEILGATAPALSGTPGNRMKLVPSPHQLSIATYGQPASGAAINMAWIPQYAPLVSATTADQTSDAAIIFGVDMMPITGFSGTVATQTLTGIGQDCGVDPCGIPSALLYNQLTWVATSSEVPASGFGYYELQRMDTVETDWQTIMEGTSPTGASYNDYEARIGIETSYRIRAVDLYGFYGEWSSTVSLTIPSPGVSGDCIEGGHILVFTTNEKQDGSDNLAYSSAWFDTRVTEDFNFPEANTVQLQPMYGRDYFTAFRPLERGGEQFTRSLLVQAAAIDPETLGDFRSLRDMAWDTVNYICVRDEDGNRWFASITVPGGVVMKSRTLYLAPVNIAEVTATPTPVDPWS